MIGLDHAVRHRCPVALEPGVHRRRLGPGLGDVVDAVQQHALRERHGGLVERLCDDQYALGSSVGARHRRALLACAAVKRN